MVTPRKLLLPTLASAFVVTLTLTLVEGRAEAQEVSRWALRGEAGIGPMLPRLQRSVLGYEGTNTQVTGRVAYNLLDALSVQLSVANGFFPMPQGQATGRTLMFEGGLRLEPLLGHVGRLWLEGNAGLVLTGDEQRFGFDGGIGFEFQVARWFGIGPMARTYFVAHAASNAPSDALYLSFGLSLTLRIPHGHAVVDTDGDGVLDPDDICPTIPAGDHPDPRPERHGCPLADTDGDGVYDDADQCPTVPAGDHPDPHRAGCPAADTDGDGVYDDVDQCPTVPAGEHPDPHRAGCPTIDSDGDGIADDADQCPTVPAGLNPDPARPGCPLPDRDRDIVPDVTDACPDRPGAPSTNPARNGCPGLVTMDEGALHIVRPVFFATDRDTILPSSDEVLAAVADALRATPAIHRVSIEGHTDDRSSMEHNMDLSNRRATSVMRWLSEHGVEANRLEAHGFGPTRPLHPIEGLHGHALNAARAANRRVEFNIIDPAIPHQTAVAGVGSTPAPTEEHHHHHHHGGVHPHHRHGH